MHAFDLDDDEGWLHPDEQMDYVDNIIKDMDIVYEFLNIDGELPLSEIFPAPHLVLVTSYHSCILCSLNTCHLITLCHHETIQKVDVLTTDRSWRKAYLFVAQCLACYYPD